MYEEIMVKFIMNGRVGNKSKLNLNHICHDAHPSIVRWHVEFPIYAKIMVKFMIDMKEDFRFMVRPYGLLIFKIYFLIILLFYL